MNSRIRKLLTRSNVLGLVAIVALVAVGTAYFVARAQEDATKDQTILVQRARITALLKQNGSLETTIAGQATEYSKLYREATASGVRPTTVAPQALAGAAGATGATGASGKDGRDGTDGRSIVSARCSSSGLTVTYSDRSTVNVGTCVGTSGANGTNGQNGANGQPGTPGTTGAAGTNGSNGVGISTVTCVSTSSGTAFQFALTDGTTQTVAGNCTPTPSATSTPSPTPGGTP